MPEEGMVQLSSPDKSRPQNEAEEVQTEPKDPKQQFQPFPPHAYKLLEVGLARVYHYKPFFKYQFSDNNQSGLV